MGKKFETKAIFICLIVLLLSACSTNARTSTTTPFPPTNTFTFPSPTLQSTTLKTAKTPTTVASTNTPVPTSTTTPTPTPANTSLPSNPLSKEKTAIPETHEILSPNSASFVYQLAQWGKGNIYKVAFSPKGELLGLASSLGVYIYNSQTFDLFAFYPTDWAVTAIQFSPNNETFAWGYSNGKIEIRQVGDGTILEAIALDPNRVIDLTYSDDGSKIEALQQDMEDYENGGKIYLLDLSNMQKLSEYTIPFRDFDLSNNGQVIAHMTDYRNGQEEGIDVKDIKSSQTLHTIPYRGFLYSVALSANGQNLVFEDVTGISIWRDDNPNGAILLKDAPEYLNQFYAYSCKIEADGPGLGSLLSSAFSPDGKSFVIASREGTIQMRRVSDGNILYSFRGIASEIVFSPDGLSFVTLPGDGTFEFHRASNGALLKKITGFTNSFTSVSFSPDGRYLAAGASDDLVRVWRVKDGERALYFSTQANQVSFAPDGGLLATGSNDGTVLVWNLTSGEKRVLRTGSSEPRNLWRINSLQFTPNGQSLIAGSQDCTIQAWDPSSGKSQWLVENGWDGDDTWSNKPVDSIASSPDNQKVAINNWNSVLFFAIRNGEALQPLTLLEKYSVKQIAFFPNEKRIAVETSEGQEFEIWDLDLFKMVYRVSGPSNNLIISPDGKLIATSDQEGNIYLWQSEDGKQVIRLRGHREGITELAFSPDGKFLASASVDGTIRLWGVQ